MVFTGQTGTIKPKLDKNPIGLFHWYLDYKDNDMVKVD